MRPCRRTLAADQLRRPQTKEKHMLLSFKPLLGVSCHEEGGWGIAPNAATAKGTEQDLLLN